MQLEQLHKELGLSTAHYTRWADKLLKDYEEGKDYTVEIGARSKKNYYLAPHVAILLLNKYLHRTDNISIDFIHNYCLYLEEDNPIRILAEGLDFADDSSYRYFLDQINRIASVSRDIPPNFMMPSESPVSYKMLQEFGIIDENNRITEEGKKVARPRVIIKANGKLDTHVILDMKWVAALTYGELE